MPASRWQRWLDLITPRSGRVRCEDGEWINVGSIEQQRERFSLLNETVNNGASILSIRMNNLAALTDHHFVIDIPAGKNLVLHTRNLTLSEGRYEVDAIAVTSVDLTTGVTNGVTAPLNKVSGMAASTVLRHRVGGVTGAVVREYGFADTGSVQTGQARAGGTTATEGVIKILSGPSILRVRKTTEGAFTANLVYVAWEFDS